MGNAAKQTLASFAKVVISSLTGGWGGLLSEVAGETIDYWKDQRHSGAITDPDLIIKKTAEAIFTYAERVGWPEERVVALGGLAADRWRSRRPSFDEIAQLNFDRETIVNRVIGNGDNIDCEDVEPVRTILTIALNQILETMPPAQILAYMREVLRRTELLIQKVDSTDEDQKFEGKYRHAVVLALDNLELYGIPESLNQRSYQLTPAFIMQRGVCAIKRPGSPTVILEPGSLDEILPHGQHFLIRGEAGFGKTTLLRWLAVQCARKQLGGLLQPWNGRIPFYIQLRDVGDTCPLPEEFPKYVASAIYGLKPKDWVTKQLDSGHALLLIDGLDEIMSQKRKHVREWLEQLLLNFPNALTIVTSRPAALTNEWLGDRGFVDVELQPLSPLEIELAIDRWFIAAANQYKSEYGDDLYYERREKDLAVALKRELKLKPAVRNLVRTPALCALLCRIWQEYGSVTATPERLIKGGLDMLLHKRDIQRGIPGHFRLNLHAHEQLLADLAYWMIRNGHFSVTVGEALASISRSQRSIPEAKGDPKHVLQHLMERVGVLQLSLAGRVEFLYQAFQEHLAARAAIKASDFGLLIQNAHLDQWSRVIVYASALAGVEGSETIIQGLIERGEKNEKQKRCLWLLAIECFGVHDSPATTPQRRIQSIIQTVAPPVNFSEAEAIAAGRDLAVPYLRGHGGRPANEVAACVRALELIGSEAALDALKKYRSDERSPVAFEFLRLAEQGYRL